ncbi:helix-turn-helix domain-containing protein [Nocardioides zeae]|uniref:helix-turn-helix domain-containing protein n=1 Tax=Nocardioides zeae TaxID=1457234 RepID=UPI0019D6148B
MTTIAPARVHVPAFAVAERAEPDQHVLLWQVRGASDVRVDGEARVLVAGQALWVPVGVRHEFTVRVNSVVLPMLFGAGATATTLQRPTAIGVDADLRTLFLAYVQTSYSIIRPPVNIARQILALLEERPALPTALPLPTSAAALAVAEALLFNPGDDRSVEELASAAHASVRTVERQFRAETGLSLRQWRIRSRMEAATVLLRSRTTTAAVAHRVGYSDVSAFRRVFKAHVGATPGEYVARYRP